MNFSENLRHDAEIAAAYSPHYRACERRVGRGVDGSGGVAHDPRRSPEIATGLIARLPTRPAPTSNEAKARDRSRSFFRRLTISRRRKHEAMPCILRFPKGCHHGGSIRIGPACTRWLAPYEHLLSFEIEDDRFAVIGGLTWTISRQDRNDIVTAFAERGYEPVMDRVKNGKTIRTKLALPTRRKNSP